MLNQLQIGPTGNGTSSLGPASVVPARAGNLGDAIVSTLHGEYYETNYRRMLYNAANQAGVTTTVGLATTYTGLCLSNPIGSSVNLVINKVGFSATVAFAAAAAIGVMAGFNSGTNVTHTTPGTPRSSFFGVGTAGTGLVDTACTLPTAPVVTHVLSEVDTAAITAGLSGPTAFFDLEGSLILPPGAYAAIYTSTASGATGVFASFSWEEIPI